ncbi:maker363 [Drosophila busckii]|uniref:Maker363 n=1 Tax=Drosophila busckii TaxID=30019 RepID=A0A0M4EKK9_DROBS|nr:maker363 [Drosophila busckii]
MMKRNRDSHLLRKTMRTRFKKLVRHVLLNLQFLDETEDQGISMNVKKNVAFLVRQKRKTGVLTIAEKALLRAKHSTRTIEERKRLCMIIATQPCFSRLPPKIRARLVSVLHFMTINTDRVIVKEGDVPIHVYFIVSGEVEMIKSSYDKITKKVSKVTEAIVGSGDWIGDVEILEDCTRINTYVTMTTCELLAISTSDFLGILGGFVKKQWLEKKAALKSLSYFDFLTEDQIIRACKNGYLMQYDPLQSIYSEETTGINYVHFILSGECVILQCLKMKVIKNEGQTTFELLNVSNNPQSLFQASSKSLKSQRIDMQGRYNILTDSVFNLQELLATSSEADREEALERKKAVSS